MIPYDAGAQLYCNDMNSIVHLGYNDLSFPLGQIVISKLSVQQKGVVRDVTNCSHIGSAQNQS